MFGFGVSKGGVGKSMITCGVTVLSRRILAIDTGRQRNTLTYIEIPSKKDKNYFPMSTPIQSTKAKHYPRSAALAPTVPGNLSP
jgi:cellulose biosynthesis protein BcsQ